MTIKKSPRVLLCSLLFASAAAHAESLIQASHSAAAAVDASQVFTFTLNNNSANTYLDLTVNYGQLSVMAGQALGTVSDLSAGGQAAFSVTLPEGGMDGMASFSPVDLELQGMDAAGNSVSLLVTSHPEL